jgi:hypothetical protein
VNGGEERSASDVEAEFADGRAPALVEFARELGETGGVRRKVLMVTERESTSRGTGDA